MKMTVSWKRFDNKPEGGCAGKRVYSKNNSRQRVLCFIFDRGCAIIYVSSIDFNLGALGFWRFIYYRIFSQV